MVDRYFFSPSLKSAYDANFKSTYVRKNSWPNDAIAISDEVYAEFFRSPSPPAGKEIGSDENGLPVWVSQAPPSLGFAIESETQWRDGELAKVLNRIDQYEKDQSYPESLRTSPIKTNEDFLMLLNDRKLLSDYPESQDFPTGERPILSGLAT